MANASIFAAFERMWQHIVAALGNKSDISYVDEKTESLLPVAGGNMTGVLGTKGINLTYKTDYGVTMPSDADDGRLFFMLDDTADRIIKFGFNNGWYYQKFESGIVKCWRSENRIITSGEWSEGKGGGINAGLISVKSSALANDIQFDLPSRDIIPFIERPMEIVSISNNTSWRALTFMGRNHPTAVTSTTTKLYNIITFNPEDNLDVTMEFYLIGRWK